MKDFFSSLSIVLFEAAITTWTFLMVLLLFVAPVLLVVLAVAGIYRLLH